MAVTQSYQRLIDISKLKDNRSKEEKSPLLSIAKLEFLN